MENGEWKMENEFVKVKLGDVVEFNPKEVLKKDKIYKKVKMECVKEFTKKIVCFEYAPYKGGSKFKNKDVLLAKITPCLENGKSAFVDFLEDDEVAFGSTEFIVLRKTDKTDEHFIYYLTLYSPFRKKAILSMEGTSGRKRVNETTLRNYTILLPKINTQKKIARVLSVIDEKIELNKKINQKLEEMAKILYEYYFVQFDFPDKNGKPYKSSGGEMVYNEKLKREIPKGWEVVELEKVIEYIKTGLNPRNHFKLGNGDKYYITIKNITQGEINFKNADKIDNNAFNKINKRANLDVGDILFTSIEPVGLTYLIQEKPKNWNINESVFVIRPNLKFITSEFLYFLLSSKELKSFAKHTSTGSIHKGIRQNVLKQFNFVYPSFELIVDFSKKTKPIFQQIYNNQLQIQKLESLRDFLLPMLLNGQVIVDEK